MIAENFLAMVAFEREIGASSWRNAHLAEYRCIRDEKN
jgi:hypothetical protein